MYQFVYEQVSALAWQEILGAAVAEGIHGSGVHQTFKGLAVHHARHPLHKVERICKRPVLPFLDDCLDYVAAETLDSAQTEADDTLLVYGELGLGLVHIRVGNSYSSLAAVGHYLLEFVHIGLVLSEVGGLEL